MKIWLVLTMFLVACGIDPKQFQEDQEKAEEDTSDTLERALGVEKSDNGTKAIAFKNNVKLEGVGKISSAVKVIDTLYFTGEDSAGNHILGKIRPDEKAPEIIPVGLLSANDIEVRGRYILPTNVDGRLYLMNDDSIVEIDLTTLEAVGKIETECAVLAPITFAQDNRWNTIWMSKRDVCGRVDGALLEARQGVKDGYTGEALTFQSNSYFTFDGVKIFVYEPQRNRLTVFGADFAKKETYSTAGYLYNGIGSSFVSDNNGGRWMFGCGDSGCYRTEVEFVEQ